MIGYFVLLLCGVVLLLFNLTWVCVDDIITPVRLIFVDCIGCWCDTLVVCFVGWVAYFGLLCERLLFEGLAIAVCYLLY